MNVSQTHQTGMREEIVRTQNHIALAGLKTPKDAALKHVELVCLLSLNATLSIRKEHVFILWKIINVQKEVHDIRSFINW